MKTTTSIERIRPRMFAKGVVAPFLALLALPMAVQAETWYLKATTTVSTPLSPSNWTNAQGTVATAINASDTLYAPQAIVLQFSTAVSHDGAFHAGAEDGSTMLTVQPRRTVTYCFNDFRWHSAHFDGAGGRYFYTITGNAIVDNPTATHKVSFRSSNGESGVAFNMNLAASSDITIDLGGSTSQNDSPFVLGGDNSAYLGNFTRTSTSQLILNSANALGSPSTACANALSVDAKNAVLSVMNGVTPNAARGIQINKSGFKICATNYVFANSAAAVYQDCSSFELPMPISGSYGFTKDGDGTVTLSGAYSAGDIVVANGTLHIAATASFPAGQNISVASGAHLVVHQSLSGFNISGAGTWERVLDPLVVEYDDSTRTATAIERGSSYQIPVGVKQPVSLSEPVALPLHVAPASQEVLTVAAGAADLSADDFVDATEKTYGLPKTSFTVEKDGSGVQHVFLTIRPVVVSVAAFNNSRIGMNGDETTWSNEAAAQPGFDYLITNLVNEIGNFDFNGDSLTIADTSEVHSRENSRISSATIYPGNTIRQNRSTGGGSWTITGNICIAGEYGGSKYLTFQARYAGGYHRLLANLSGAGPLKLVGAGVDAGIVGGYPLGSPQLYGDNSAYHGKMYVTYSDNNRTEHNGTPFGFNSAAALGGALDTFQYDSLQLDRFSMICPATSMDFSTANRGIYGSGPFGFNVTNGVTFRVGVPVRMDDDMFKHGGGDLLLGGAISFGENSSKTCYVREGGIGALADAAVAGLDVVFSNATKIVVSPDAALADGFTGGLSFEPADAATTVAVSVADGFSPSGDGPVTAVIATVPTSAGDLSSRFVPSKLPGLTGKIETESVTVEGTPCTRYTVKFVPAATMILFR